MFCLIYTDSRDGQDQEKQAFSFLHPQTQIKYFLLHCKTSNNQCLSHCFLLPLFCSVMNLDDLTRRGLYLSDIPLHDATRDLVLLGEQFREEYKLTQELEILTDRLQHTLRALEDEKKKTDRLDYYSQVLTVASALSY